MSTSKRIISLLLALVMVLGMLPWDALGVEAAGLGRVIHVAEEPVKLIQNEEPIANSDGIAVTRAQWLQMLVAVFGYSIEDEIVPDNYYPDLSKEAEYYEDILVAIYYGLVDVLPNSPMEPEAAATREFAVSTLNSCMGYLPENEPSFVESGTVTYPDDIQVAVEQGWFVLTDGAFLPEQPITQEEFDLLKIAAEEYVEEFTIVPTESQYSFKDGIIEITDKAQIEILDGIDIVTIANCTVDIAAGDKFVVYNGGLAIPYVAESVSLDGANTVIVTADLAFEDAIETMLVQQETDTDPANFYAAEDTELIFIEEDSGQKYSQQAVMELMASGSTKVYVPKYSKTIDFYNGAKLSLNVELKNAKVCYDVDIGLLKGNASVWLDTDVEVSGKLSCDVDDILDNDIEIYIGGYEVPGVGGLSVYIKVDVTGSLSVVKKYHMKVGLKVGCDISKWKGSVNKIFKLTDKGSSYNAEISSKICLEIKFGLYGKALPIKGYFYGEGGFKATVKYTTYQEITGSCTHFAAYMYAEFGVKVEWGILGYEQELDWNYEMIKEENSPVKLSFHYEDGRYVYGCTRKGMTGTTTGDPSKIVESGYSTGYDSSYFGSGLYSGGSSTGYGNGGEPIIIYTYSLDDKNNATITSYSGNATSLTIPLILDGYNVTAIGSNAFENQTGLQTIIMLDNILTIGSGAFYGCTNLRNLTLSENLMTIEGSAFNDCTSLTEIVIPDTVTKIGCWAFNNCSALQFVTLSKSLAEMEYGAFGNCSSLTKIEIPKSLTYTSTWGYDGPFSNCSNLKTVTFEEGTTEIASGLFSNCTGLEHITIPDTVTVVEGNAFSGALNLETVTLSRNLIEIQGAAFDSCISLTEIVIPDTVTKIGCWAFNNCSALQFVTLSKSLAEMEYGAFGNCSSLTKIEIPKSLTYTSTWGYDGPFSNCSNLKTVTFEEGTTEIASGLFSNCTGLEHITIPDTVTVVEGNAFSGALNLETVTLSRNLIEIQGAAFDSCTSLTEIAIPDTVTKIGAWAFMNCTSLMEIVIPNTVTEIGESVFADCFALTTIIWSDSLTRIPESTFYNCTSLVNFAIPDSVTELWSEVFYNCDSLTSITIPYGVTSIGSSAFYDCDALETVDMANSVTSLGSSVFKHCDLLKNVKLSRNLTAIPSEAFRECAELEEIVIPYFTTKIEANAFNSSHKLTKVVTHEKLTTINTSAFSYADRTVFYGPTGSYTNTWCTENGYSFVENTAATTKVTAAESSVTIPKGKTYMLDFDIDPIDFHEIITTKSSNTAVATVDETGKITAVAPGTATIKIIVGGASASCKVTVTQAVTKIQLNKTSLSLDVPETYQLTATITPSDASNKNLIWSSSNESAATVDENGLVKAVGNGTAVIKAEAADGSSISASCTVTVIDPSKIPVSSITLNKTALSLEAMETYQLTASVSPANAANKALIWTSSNEAVATVDSNGQVTAVAKGTATITATAADGYGASASCTVTVTNNGYVVTSLDQFQSSHPYENGCTDFWLYTQPGAGSVSITFDAETEMEDGFDYLYIYDGEGNLIGKYTGTELANQTITIPGDTVKVQIESDDSGNAWGFRVTDIGFTDHTHSFTNYVSDGNATCTEDGTKTARCDHCDATDTIPDAGSALGHDMGSWETTVPVTCTENGEEERNCSRCDHSESRVIEAVGHRWDNGVVTREPTEDTEGERLYTCTSCGATRTESIPVIGHEHRYEAAVTAPTCTERGYTTYTCKCGESYVADYVAALGHSFGDWAVIQEPTTTEDGLEERSCFRCGHTEQRTVAKLENPFNDVAPGSFYYEPVMWAVENGITNGTSATTFGPNDQCMRAHVVTFLWRAVGCPEPTQTDNPFVDVKPGDFYYKPVLWAVENGITSGMDATHFGPTAYCNRAQVVTFLYRTMGNPDVGAASNPFTDVAVGSFYEKPVLWAVENGVTAGMSATSFGPNSICNRAQIVTFLYRTFVD